MKDTLTVNGDIKGVMAGCEPVESALHQQLGFGPDRRRPQCPKC